MSRGTSARVIEIPPLIGSLELVRSQKGNKKKIHVPAAAAARHLSKRTAPFKAEGAGIESSLGDLTLDAHLKGGTSLLSPGQEETGRAMGEKSGVAQGDFATESITDREGVGEGQKDGKPKGGGPSNGWRELEASSEMRRHSLRLLSVPDIRLGT